MSSKSTEVGHVRRRLTHVVCTSRINNLIGVNHLHRRVILIATIQIREVGLLNEGEGQVNLRDAEISMGNRWDLEMGHNTTPPTWSTRIRPPKQECKEALSREHKEEIAFSRKISLATDAEARVDTHVRTVQRGQLAAEDAENQVISKGSAAACSAQWTNRGVNPL